MIQADGRRRQPRIPVCRVEPSRTRQIVPSHFCNWKVYGPGVQIGELTGNLARRALIRARATFVAEIGGVLIAEGVEDLDDLDLLGRARRPILVQGLGVGIAVDPWPVPAPSAVRHLRSRRRERRREYRDGRSARGSSDS